MNNKFSLICVQRYIFPIVYDRSCAKMFLHASMICHISKCETAPSYGDSSKRNPTSARSG